MKRRLEDLNLLDDFLFGSMVSYPGIGERFVRLLLQIIFRRKFGKLVVRPQKVYYGSDTDKHGTRLDVYLEEEPECKFPEPDGEFPTGATIYDVEPDMPYDDGAMTVYLYTKGCNGNPPEELQQLLRYMETTTEENASTKELQDIQQMVEEVKHDEEVSIQYMKAYEREEMLLNRGRREERANTEAQRLRADTQQKRAEAAEREAAQLREEIERLKANSR